MASEAEPNPRPTPVEPARLRTLGPSGEPITAQEFADRLTLPGRAPGPGERPYVLLNMVSTADGRATIAGRSGPLGNRADRELFHALRTVVDGVMVGAGTVRTERYGRIIPDESRRRARQERGLSEEPLACLVSGRLALAADIPLLATPGAHVVIVTSSRASLTACAAHVEYVRAQRDGLLDLPAALAELRARFALDTLLCEGGPHLSAQLFAAGLVDELFLSLAPKLAGGDPATGGALRILAGPALQTPVGLKLLGLLENDAHLFLRYAVGAPPPDR